MVAKASYAALNWETQHTELHLIRFCRNFGAIPSVFNGADFHVGARIWSSSAGQEALPGHDTKPMISLDRLVCRAYGAQNLEETLGEDHRSQSACRQHQRPGCSLRIIGMLWTGRSCRRRQCWLKRKRATGPASAPKLRQNRFKYSATTAASAASGCTGLLRAFLGEAAFFGVGNGQLERAGLGCQPKNQPCFSGKAIDWNHGNAERACDRSKLSPAANVRVRKSAHNTNISKPLGWRVFASHWVVLLLLATEKGPSPASSQGKH